MEYDQVKGFNPLSLRARGRFYFIGITDKTNKMYNVFTKKNANHWAIQFLINHFWNIHLLRKHQFNFWSIHFRSIHFRSIHFRSISVVPPISGVRKGLSGLYLDLWSTSILMSKLWFFRKKIRRKNLIDRPS